MIIDLILDRKDGEPYDAKHFYNEVMDYGYIWPQLANPITSAMDGGTNEEVQKALCLYVTSQGYNESICDYVNNVDWI